MGNLLGKLLGKALPLDKALALALKLGVLRAPLEMLGKAFAGAKGYRSQALLALAAGVGVAAFFGFIPWDLATTIVTSLVSAAAPTLLEKVNRIMAAAEKVSGEVAKNAPAPAGEPEKKV